MNIDIKVTPKNILKWGNYEDWENGASAAPTENTLDGVSATVARESTIIKQGTYSAAVTRAGNDALLYYNHPDFADYEGHRMTFGCWVYATVASRARISLRDGVDISYSSYHSGVAGWEWLTVTRNIDASATRLTTGGNVDTGDTTAFFDGGILVDGPLNYLDTSSYFENWSIDNRFRQASHRVSRRPGLIIPDSEFDSLGLNISGNVYGATATAARDTYDDLMQYLSVGEKDVYIYDDRYIRAFLTSKSDDRKAANRVIVFDLKFITQIPFYQYVQYLRKTQAISSSPTSFTLTVNGNVYSQPIINFIAGGSNITSCTLENITRGETMSFTGTVTAGNTLVIDGNDLTVLNNSVDEIGSFSGDFLRLNPGDNILKFTGSNCTIKVDWADRWL